MNLIVIADSHYIPAGIDLPKKSRRQFHLGAELVRRALDDAQRCGPVDVVAVMGDWVNDGTQPYASEALAKLAEQIQQAAGDAELLAVTGNHDVVNIADALGVAKGPRTIGGYRFYVFDDPYEPDDRCTRPSADLEAFARYAADGDEPIITLQHNPIYPPIDLEYPYMLQNADAVMQAYTQAGVLLSISGHYHPGQGPEVAGGVPYYTAPAVCEPPFRYAIITLDGRDVKITDRTLQLDDTPALIDSHVHTEFAYCGTDITAAGAIERMDALNLGRLCLVEHAPQLYVDRETFWDGWHIRRPDTWRASRGRMDDFRRQILPLRSDRVSVGLEVELDADGQLTLQDADREGLDLLVGGVHFFPRPIEDYPPSEFVEQFLKVCEGLCRGGVDILAHPLRAYRKARCSPDAAVFEPLADLLAETGTAAEINFHHHRPLEAFIAACLDRGVKFAFGSDAHRLGEVGNLRAYVDLLQRVAGVDDIAPLMWRLA